MTRRPDLRRRWRTAVLADDCIGNATKVLLLFLAEHMRDNGYVSVPVPTICAGLATTAARVSERISEARRGQFLDSIEQGRPGRTATYCATFPSADRDRKAVRPGRRRQEGVTLVAEAELTRLREEAASGRTEAALPDVQKDQFRTYAGSAPSGVRKQPTLSQLRTSRVPSSNRSPLPDAPAVAGEEHEVGRSRDVVAGGNVRSEKTATKTEAAAASVSGATDLSDAGFSTASTTNDAACEDCAADRPCLDHYAARIAAARAAS